MAQTCARRDSRTHSSNSTAQPPAPEPFFLLTLAAAPFAQHPISAPLRLQLPLSPASCSTKNWQKGRKFKLALAQPCQRKRKLKFSKPESQLQYHKSLATQNPAHSKYLAPLLISPCRTASIVGLFLYPPQYPNNYPSLT
ncbi:hypothetical protein GBA52_018077 [Prunus armeniaca]|nr:hypothetical protein GBA52_018077 [Prunus armeniaca]